MSFQEKLDILLVSKTKIDGISCSIVLWRRVFRFVQVFQDMWSCAYILLYVRENMRSKLINLKSFKNEALEEFFVAVALII